MRPRAPWRSRSSSRASRPGEEAYVTVAAVDVGILNLTRYEPPEPADYFFGQRQLSAECATSMATSSTACRACAGAIRSGGDGGGLSGDAIPPTQEPVARYSGVVKVGPDGTAKVSFDIPGFNGTVRVMAVAWTNGRAGSASADVIVRDPVVVAGHAAALPEPVGDQSRFFLRFRQCRGPGRRLHHRRSTCAGPWSCRAPQRAPTVKLAANGRSPRRIPVTAAGVGLATLDCG